MIIKKKFISIQNTIIIKKFSKFADKIVDSIDKKQKKLHFANELTQRVIQNVENQQYSKENIDKLKYKTNFEQSVHNLEQELLQEMAKAVGQTESKVIYWLEVLKKLQQNIQKTNDPLTKQQLIQDFNLCRSKAIQARTNLIIHRQCLGFTIKNHETVIQLYPIPYELK